MSGTLFMVNGPAASPVSILVPQADGQMRFWRNTAVATLGSGQTYTTPAGVLGYEWDMDLDNGARPAGLIDMSTTIYSTQNLFLLDNGSTYGAGTPIHHLTLYRHASGALVFGAGTVQWPWGLDSNHDNNGTATDTNMQQATINVFADMGVQPGTLVGGLVAATQSTDTIPPTSVINSPANGASIVKSTVVTISGTATDTGGGKVGGVEVSTDGGATWHPATGRASWTYSWTVPSTLGGVTLMSRATDDSANIQSAPASASVTIVNSIGSSFSISGNVAPPASASGVTVTLSGASNATTTTDSSGNYSFAGLANGGYTVTPAKSGFTFTPASLPETVSNANITGANFTIQSVPTFSISGTISPAASGSGATVTLSGTSSGTTTADTSGNFTFNGLLNGSYTVTPSKAGFSFTPASQPATVNNANVTGLGFTAQAAQAGTITIDANVSQDQNASSATIASPVFSTTSTNELLLAFVSTDFLGSGTNTTVSSIAGGGLAWTLVLRTNTQKGDAEIWRAFAPAVLNSVTVTATLSQSIPSSITVMSFSGVDATGTNGSGAIGATKSANAASGAPAASLVTTRNNSLVLGVGNDYDNAIARTLGSNQTLVHQFLSAAGDTYWVQRQTAATPTSGTTVTINDTAPTSDRYNLSICEVLPSLAVVTTYGISGTVSPAASGTGATITLSGAANATTTADASGNFTFTGLANGSYTVTPAKTGFTFTPANAPATIASANVTGVAFTIQAVPTFTISGSITPSTSGSGTTVSLTGTSNATTTADSSGNYSFAGLANGTYTVRPTMSGFTFNPVNQLVTINGANMTGINFTIQAVPTFTISGSVTPSASGSGTTLTLTGAGSGTTTADSSGNYSFAAETNGTYTITPSKTGFAFTPATQSVTVNGANITGANFTAQTAQASALAIDVSSSADQDAASTTVKTPAFSTAFANELLLAFIATDAPGSGTNTIVNSVSGGGLTWVLVLRTNTQKGDSEVWRAFAPVLVSNATVTVTLSNSVASTLTVMSFAGADVTGTNGSGAIGATKSANAASGAPTASLTTTRANSWVFGVGNDYDNAIGRTLGANQTLIHQFLSSLGDTYWVQRQNTPTAVSGTLVNINDTAPTTDRYDLAVVEILPSLSGGGSGTPPVVSMLAPASNQTVTNKATVAANAFSTTSAITGVQFLLDGVNLASQVTAAPYSMTWDTTTATAGNHTLSAIAFDSSGLNSAATPITIKVDNSGNATVVGSWSAPVTLPTVAVNLVLLKNNTVLFYEDGASTTVWDYTNSVFTSIPATPDLFCSGHADLPDGRILVVGGYGGSSTNIGIANAEIFDPSLNKWTAIPNTAYKRWYPTATPLADGRVMVTGGWQTSSHTNAGIPEIYDPSTNLWTQLTKANNPFETYPFIIQLTDGRLLHVGGTEYPTVTEFLDLTTQTWTSVDARIIDGASATMYLPNKILKAGSATDSQNAGPSSNTAFTLDMTQTTPMWQQVPSMAYPRSFMNLTELPDGTVLATGGETDKNGGNIANAVYAAELWSPATQTWTTMASMHTPREYHSTALLLPDGRVLQSGMGADFGNVPDEMTAEFYSPPYLFKGTRPTITSAPTGVAFGANFFVGTPDGATITSAVLIRTAAVTHFFDQNTRFVPVTFTQTTGGLTITAPANGNIASPGYYMLFLVNSNGVPAIAPILQLHP
jgi:hypothetical protein